MRAHPLGGRSEGQEPRLQVRLRFQMQCRDEQGLERRQIGQPLVLFQAADLRFAVANREGKFQRRQPFSPPQYFNRSPKVAKASGVKG